jgi:hypothetical protein
MAAKQAAEKKPIRLQHPAELNERSRKIVEILQGQGRDRQIEDFWCEWQIFLSAREADKGKRASQSRQRRHPDEKGRIQGVHKPCGKLGRRRTRIEDATEFAFDRSQPFADFLDGMENKKAFAPSSGGAGKSVPYQAAVENGGRKLAFVSWHAHPEGHCGSVRTGP